MMSIDRKTIWRGACAIIFATLLELFSLEGNGQTIGQTQPSGERNLYFLVIDASGSIVSPNNLLTPIRNAVTDFIKDGVGEQDEVRLAFFSDEASFAPAKWKSMTPDAKADFLNYFQKNYRPKGETRLYDTIAEVALKVQSEIDQYRSIRIHILSDGEDYPVGKHKLKSWTDVEAVVGKLITLNPGTEIDYWSLGFDPVLNPSINGPIKHKKAPRIGVDRIALTPAPRAEFTARPETALVGQAILFAVKDRGGPASVIRWQFGDGTASTNKVAEHIYTKKGEYDVTLEVQGPGGTDTTTTKGAIRVMDAVPLQASFSWFPPVIRVGESVRFNDESIGGPTQWQWSFPGMDAKNNQSAVVSFKTSGEFRVELVITKDGQRSQTNAVINILPPAPDAAFTSVPSFLQLGESVRLKATANEQNWVHSWTVAGDTKLEGPEVVWFADRTGRVEVTHWVVGPGGVGTTNDLLFVGAKSTAPVAQFSWIPEKPRANEEFTLLDESDGGPTRWTWTIQNAGTRSDKNPRLRVASPGKTSVQLTVERDGKTHSVIHLIDVLPQLAPRPDAGFDVTPRMFKQGETVKISAKDSPGWRHEWTIGGKTYSGASVNWRSDRTGLVEVLHRVYTAETNNESRIEIFGGKTELATADFEVSPAKGTSPLEVHCKVLREAGVVVYDWTFGDGTSSSEREPRHTYASSGSFFVSLKLKNVQGDITDLPKKAQVTVKAPMSGGTKALIGGGLLAAFGAVVGWALWNKKQKSRLMGTLSWSFDGKTGKSSLEGFCLNLKDLNIPGWKPTGTYTLLNTPDGHKIMTNRIEIKALTKEKVEFEIERVRFIYLNQTNL